DGSVAGAQRPPPHRARAPGRDARRPPSDPPLAPPLRPASAAHRFDFGNTRVYGARGAMSVLNTKVLVLNRSYLPIQITSVRRAISLLYQDIARAVDEQYRLFDFASWADLAADEATIALVKRAIRVPRVILLLDYDLVPRRYVRLS